MGLSRDQFFSAARTARLESVDVPALGGAVHLRPMTVGEREAFELAHVRLSQSHFRERLIVASACDADGVLLFTADDVPALSGLPSPAIEPIVKAAVKLNGFGDDEVKELEKNS